MRNAAVQRQRIERLARAFWRDESNGHLWRARRSRKAARFKEPCLRGSQLVQVAEQWDAGSVPSHGIERTTVVQGEQAHADGKTCRVQNALRSDHQEPATVLTC
jgi:hypothetical protein